MKRFYIVICLLLVNILIHSLSPADSAQPQTIRIAAFNFYPTLFQDKDGSVQGFYVDFLKEIAKRENWNIEYVYGNWADGLARIKTGEVELLTNVAFTNERDQFMDYGRVPLLTVWAELYVNGGSSIDSIKGVKGKKIALMKGDFNAANFKNLVEKLEIPCTYVELGNFEEVFKAISSKEVEAGVVNNTFGAAKQREYGVQSSGVVFNPFDIYFTAAKGKNTQVLATLDKYLAEWRNDEESPYHQARERWSHKSVSIMKVTPASIRRIVIFFVLTSCIAIVFVFVLRIQVRRKTTALKQEIEIRAEAEERLRESKLRLDTILDNVGAYIFIKDTQYCYTFANRKVCELFGQSEDDIIGKHDSAFFSADSLEEIIRSDRSVIERGETVRREEADLTVKDSLRRTYWTVKIPLRDSKDKIYGLCGISTDITELKQTEEDLSQQKALFEAIFTCIPDGIVYASVDREVIAINSAFSSMFGFSIDDLKGKKTSFFYESLEEYERQGKIRFNMTAAVQTLPYEVSYRRKDGSVFPGETLGTAVKDTKGTLLGYLGVVRDIAERKQVEAALQKKDATVRNKLKAILEPEGDIGTLELSDIIDTEMLKSLMENFYQLTGILGAVLDISGNVLVAVGWQDICTKFHRCNPDTNRNCIESDTILTNEVPVGTFRQYRCKNNMWDIVTPLEIGGQHMGNVFIGQFFYEDETPDIEVFREQARKFGFDETEYLAALDRVPRISREMADAGIKFYLQVTKMISDLSFSSIKVSRMLTERIHLEEQLRQSQKMEAIGTLAGGIAHDFNNMLGAILGYAEMIRDDFPPDSPGIHDIGQVLKASHRAKELVKQILAFSRQAEDHKIPMQPAAIVKEAINLLRSSLPTTITIKQDIDPEAGIILADPGQIHQVIMNLCTNAFHAMEAGGGTLTISLNKKALVQGDLSAEPHLRPGTFVQLSIRDTGKGIVPEIREKIFEPFFTTKEVGKGTGLGLAMVYGIVKSCGGSISCDSLLGEGTEFRITLPTLEGNALPESESSEPVPHGVEHILLVDDEEMLLELGHTMLERLGYHVTARRNSIEALTAFQKQPDAFDIVITDQTMPGMTGIDLARRILQIRPDMPIILCTGYSSLITEDKAKAAGVKGFAFKPLAKKDIGVLIREIMNGNKQ